MGPSHTWRGTRALAATPLLAIAIAGALALAAESVARSNVARDRLLPASVGSPFRLLDEHLRQLDGFARTGTAVDCLVIGNSLPLVGVEPQILAEAFTEKTGKRLNCYNLGVPGIRARAAGALGRAVMEDSGAWVLFYAISPREFTPVETGPGIERIPWLRFRAGEPLLEGWLVNASYAYRYYLLYRAWSDPSRRRFIEYRPPISPWGFMGLHHNADLKGNPEENARKVKVPLVARLDAGISEEAFAQLHDLLELRRSGHQVVLLEMPAAQLLLRALREESSNLEAILTRIQTEAERAGVPFWRFDPSATPDDTFVDLYHLNRQGAESYSRWLAGRIANGLAAGEIAEPSARDR